MPKAAHLAWLLALVPLGGCGLLFNKMEKDQNGLYQAPYEPPEAPASAGRARRLVADAAALRRHPRSRLAGARDGKAVGDATLLQHERS
ncbi:MAG: hypothetical protein QM767_08050 [Anaeromyxobacter sp.]